MCLLHLAQPFYVALGQALIWGCIQIRSPSAADHDGVSAICVNCYWSTLAQVAERVATNFGAPGSSPCPGSIMRSPIKEIIIFVRILLQRTLLQKAFQKRNPIDKALKSCLDISPKSRACPRATQAGLSQVWSTSPCQRSWHRKKFQRKADKKSQLTNKKTQIQLIKPRHTATRTKDFLNLDFLGFSFRIPLLFFYPPATKASREVANLTERKNQHSPVHGVKY